MSWLVLAIIVLLLLAVVIIRRFQAIERKRKYKLRKRQAAKELPKLVSSPEPLPPLSASVPRSVPPPPIAKPPLLLLSEAGIDYTQLQNLLAAMRWQDADAETREIMLDLTDCQAQKYIDPKSMPKLPCTDLRTIDSLWLNYSNCHFGFSVQSHIWQESGQDCHKFGEAVGWCKHGVFIWESDLIYDLSAPAGHLPVAYLPIVGGCLWTVLDSISLLNRRFKQCYQKDC